MDYTYQSFLSILQLASPALPLGAYSYSEGLEFLTINQITNQEQLYSWLKQELMWGTIRVESALMLRACDCTIKKDLEKLSYWNNWLTANRETNELRQQSWQMGNSLMKLLSSLDSGGKLERIKISLSPPYNYAIAFGIAVANWDIELELALLGYLQNWATNLINAAVKLIPLGQTAGQKILWQLNPAILQQSRLIFNLKDDSLNSCSLGLGLASMRHEHQYCRLFRS